MEHPQPTLRLRTDTNEICTFSLSLSLSFSLFILTNIQSLFCFISFYYFNFSIYLTRFRFTLKGTIEEQQELERIRNAQQKVKYEISQLLTKYSEVAQQITQLRREIHKLQTRSNSKSNAK
jgi:peptidoglycan hydrolase CwlO-like protein